MDVTFREEESYYIRKDDLDQFLGELSPVNESDHWEGKNEINGKDTDPSSEISGGVIVGGVVPQDVEVTSPEKSSNDESHDEKSGDGNINDDLNIDSPEEMEDGDVVVVGTIPCPTREKVNEK